MCGEQVISPLFLRQISGSPPRVRGTDADIVVDKFHVGITPACAGNSLPFFASSFPTWDHPRVCGEQAVISMYGCRRSGSPPRVRGTDRLGTKAKQPKRITPACAGNSLY